MLRVSARRDFVVMGLGDAYGLGVEIDDKGSIVCK